MISMGKAKKRSNLLRSATAEKTRSRQHNTSPPPSLYLYRIPVNKADQSSPAPITITLTRTRQTRLLNPRTQYLVAKLTFADNQFFELTPTSQTDKLQIDFQTSYLSAAKPE